jgi:biopolymer transport protein ExbD
MLVDINVTSFVDIIFNLLIFFVLSTSFTSGASSSGLVVDLPAAASKDSINDTADVVIALTKDGQVVVGGKAMTLDDVGPVLDTWKKQGSHGMVIVQADAEVPHGKVVEIIDHVKAKGILRVVIAAQGQ